ncbi:MULTISPECIES: hypothetical protein [Micromonospora]|uniref:hypothetical protein n=1 Tax=Micromonospora TaxID=1873 RepID=UPI001B37527A|nr:hypothetical protein [Micromonospora sp. C72]MBQ1044122.1 hypothetical protein [Micromonospora sp. C72]
MLVDARWIMLVAVFTLVLVMVRKRKEWAEPLLVATAVATLLLTVLFFISEPLGMLS